MKIPYTRKEFCINVIVIHVIFLIAIYIFELTGDYDGILFAGFARIVLLILIEIRRFHDANKNAWFLLINLISLGWVIALIASATMKSNYKNNKWIGK